MILELVTRPGILRARTQYRWRLKAANGRIIATSGESYNNRQDRDDAAALALGGRFVWNGRVVFLRGEGAALPESIKVAFR